MSILAEINPNRFKIISPFVRVLTRSFFSAEGATCYSSRHAHLMQVPGPIANDQDGNILKLNSLRDETDR